MSNKGGGIQIGDFGGLGKVLGIIPDTIEAIGNFEKNMAEARKIGVETINNALQIPFNFSKNFEELVDRNNTRRIRDIKRANIPLNDEDIANMNNKLQEIKDNAGGDLSKIPEQDLLISYQLDTFKKNK